jgi:hypothetical protein
MKPKRTKEEIEKWLEVLIQFYTTCPYAKMTPKEFIQKYYYDAYDWIYGELRI